MKEYRFIKYKRLNKWLLSDVPTLRSGTPQSQALNGKSLSVCGQCQSGFPSFVAKQLVLNV
jgi:hypothetical protein